MLKFLYNYGWIILLIALYTIILYKVYKKKGKAAVIEKLRADVYALMLKAEKKWGRDNGTGAFKFSFVINEMYKLFPETAVMFISSEEFKAWVQNLYDKIKDKLDDGKLNNSI